VPEEINRRIVDHISDFNLVYTESARRNLISEGLPSRRIYLTGSPMKEVLDFYLQRINRSNILRRLSLRKRNYFLVSIHREENVDNPCNLNVILETLRTITHLFRKRIIVSAHPRTRKRIESFRQKTSNRLISFLKPFGFFDYVALERNAICVISDSGTISEESSILGFPAITIRNAMERPEAMDVGSIILTGIDKDRIIDSLLCVTKQGSVVAERSIPPEYLVRNTSERVLKLIIGTAKLSNQWDAISAKTLMDGSDKGGVNCADLGDESEPSVSYAEGLRKIC